MGVWGIDNHSTTPSPPRNLLLSYRLALLTRHRWSGSSFKASSSDPSTEHATPTVLEACGTQPPLTQSTGAIDFWTT